MKEFIKAHWDVGAGISGIIATVAVDKFNVWVAFLIGVCTLIFVACKSFIWLLKARIAFRNRNNTRFFEKVKDEETET